MGGVWLRQCEVVCCCEEKGEGPEREEGRSNKGLRRGCKKSCVVLFVYTEWS